MLAIADHYLGDDVRNGRPVSIHLLKVELSEQKVGARNLPVDDLVVELGSPAEPVGAGHRYGLSLRERPDTTANARPVVSRCTSSGELGKAETDRHRPKSAEDRAQRHHLDEYTDRRRQVDMSGSPWGDEAADLRTR